MYYDNMLTQAIQQYPTVDVAGVPKPPFIRTIYLQFMEV